MKDELVAENIIKESLMHIVFKIFLDFRLLFSKL